ncbi:MAG TPA: hypothetical protein VN878_09475 [Usitatibacter sp.]|nr:hypothetical protein [Usitatibacter sp.]
MVCYSPNDPQGAVRPRALWLPLAIVALVLAAVTFAAGLSADRRNVAASPGGMAAKLAL